MKIQTSAKSVLVPPEKGKKERKKVKRKEKEGKEKVKMDNCNISPKFVQKSLPAATSTHFFNLFIFSASSSSLATPQPGLATIGGGPETIA